MHKKADNNGKASTLEMIIQTFILLLPRPLNDSAQTPKNVSAKQNWILQETTPCCSIAHTNRITTSLPYIIIIVSVSFQSPVIVCTVPLK